MDPLETVGRDTPILRINPEIANLLLADLGNQIDDLKFEIDDLKQDQFLIIPTEKTVEMNVQGFIYEDEQARHVIGHLPGAKEISEPNWMII